MSLKILFSPIGNTDPWRNNRDGAMLHIVRYYKPELVYLFITKSLWEGNDRFEGHKNYEWENIIQQISERTKVIIDVVQIDEEHDFDSYKDIFHEKISMLTSQFNPKEILLNVTSGTPQMETTLCLEYVTYPENKKCIQVASPAKSSNANYNYSTHEEVEIDIEIVNEEESKHESRCKEIEIISFREAMLRSQLKTLILNYDYEAAYQLLVPNISFKNRKQLMDKLRCYKDSIKNHQVITEIDEKNIGYLSKKALFHYWLIRIKEERKDIAEQLIRIKSLAEYVIEQYLKRKYKDLLIDKKFNVKLNTNYDENTINAYKEVLYKNNMNFQPHVNLGLVSYVYLLEVLEKDSIIQENVRTILTINDLRNNVAHNLEELKIDKEANENLKASMNALKTLLIQVFKDIKEKDLSLIYDINQSLEELL